MAKKQSESNLNKADSNFNAGYASIKNHPIFGTLAGNAFIRRTDSYDNKCPKDGWTLTQSNGVIWVNPKRLATPDEWAYLLGHSLLHLGFDHFRGRTKEPEWIAACEVFAHQFLIDLKIGKPPEELLMSVDVRAQSEERLYERFKEDGVPKSLVGFGTAGTSMSDFVYVQSQYDRKGGDYWQQSFASGISLGVQSAINVAAGLEPFLGANTGAKTETPAARARRWFIDSYPLLGALAASFKLIEDPAVCVRMQISVAAISSEMKEIYINPAAGLTVDECKFVMAHEFMHAGLRHELRQGHRDAYLWNVACDYVINGWLTEMEVGARPHHALYDLELKGLSAESVYDRIASDLRMYRRLATLRGSIGDHGDIMLPEESTLWETPDGISLDEFYRRCLSQGLSYHEEGSRGFLPAGLIEEIKALSHPPMPWDVELAQWFDHHFPPVEKRRTYARPSRRQSSTPDIARPSYQKSEPDDSRTFGVVLDTSGSMDRQLLAKALGAIASYCNSREVQYVRVVFCDAAAYDQGYMSADDIAGRVKVKGRGGTVLQPGINLLEKAKDFPDSGPILVITDGECDHVRIRREHAFLIPTTARLPFAPHGKVFRIKVESGV
jgi:predicted metal-dependent peptidase